MTQVEIRIPTYRRPNLLRRALNSLIAQSHKNWVCRVLDDSINKEARDICLSFGDSRIKYEPNDRNLGISLNIDRSFTLCPLPDSKYLCVLEDDNYYLPSLIECNIAYLEKFQSDIILRNQMIERMYERDKPGILTSVSIFDGQYIDGMLEHYRLLSTFFYSSGATNSSLFWRSGRGLDFSTIQFSSDVVSQERLRTLCIDRDVVVGMQPLVVWRDNGSESLRPKLKTSIAWRLAQLQSLADERLFHKVLREYLDSLSLKELPFMPIVGEFSAEQERVFWRSGVPVPSRYRKVNFVERTNLILKRLCAEILTAPIYKPKPIKIDGSSGRLISLEKLTRSGRLKFRSLLS